MTDSSPSGARAALPPSGVRAAAGLFLLRLLVGWVFQTEGMQMFLYPATLGAGSLSVDAWRRRAGPASESAPSNL